MMQQELLLPRWPSFNLASSILDHITPCYDQEIDIRMVNDYEFSSTFTSQEDSSVFSSNSYLPPMIEDEFFDLKGSSNATQICSTMEGLETISSEDIDDIYEWINGDDIQANSSLSSQSNHNSSVFAAMEVDDDEMTLSHLLQAYGEAVENGERELADVIVNSINTKSSPLGNTTQRVVYNLFQSREREERSKNFATAFRVLYQSIPNGRFAHFGANSTILDSVPDYAEVIHVVDFDVGEGIQWPPLIEALSRREKAVRVKLTSLRPQESTSSCWEFDETKKMLLSHAKQYGLKLQIEEKGFQDFCSEMMREKKRGEWVVFNCMVGLPHMGRRWPRKSVDGFLEAANSLLAIHEGIIILGDGEGMENMNNNFSLYFDNMIRHYQAVFESLEMNFPAYLAEARAAMECLFLEPSMCPNSWFRDCEEKRNRDFRVETLSGGRRISVQSLLEAKEMVVEGENSYNVRIEGMRENEMVLRWKETPLVRLFVY